MDLNTGLRSCTGLFGLCKPSCSPYPLPPRWSKLMSSCLWIPVAGLLLTPPPSVSPFPSFSILQPKWYFFKCAIIICSHNTKQFPFITAILYWSNCLIDPRKALRLAQFGLNTCTLDNLYGSENKRLLLVKLWVMFPPIRVGGWELKKLWLAARMRITWLKLGGSLPQ